MTPLLTVAMPAYNEAANLPQNVPRLIERLSMLQPSFEIVIVNDGSQDATPQIAEALAQQDSRVRVYHHPFNRGIGAGFVTALQAARGEFLILIPADLALNLDQLHRYLDAARDADLVVGCTSARTDYTVFRNIVSVVNIRLIQWLFGLKQRQFNYISLYRTRLLKDMDIEYAGSAFFFAEIIIKARDRGARIVEADLDYVPRKHGKATGARPSLILKTGRDMIHFWLRRKLF